MRTHKHLYYPLSLKLSNCDHVTETLCLLSNIQKADQAMFSEHCSHENAISSTFVSQFVDFHQLDLCITNVEQFVID